MKNDKEKNQGKQSTADTKATYNRNADKIKGSSTTSQNSTTPSPGFGSGDTTNSAPRQGRGWHGDSEGHAKAGSQSHKNSDKKQA
jgi:hypothetical protein